MPTQTTQTTTTSMTGRTTRNSRNAGATPGIAFGTHIPHRPAPKPRKKRNSDKTASDDQTDHLNGVPGDDDFGDDGSGDGNPEDPDDEPPDDEPPDDEGPYDQYHNPDDDDDDSPLAEARSLWKEMGGSDDAWTLMSARDEAKKPSVSTSRASNTSRVMNCPFSTRQIMSL